MVVLSEVSSEQELIATLQRIMTAIALPHTFGDQEVVVSSSLGVTVYPDDEVDAETLLRHADQAMYRAKGKGRNCFHFFDVVDERNAHLRTEGRTRIEQALESNELELYYQPKVHLGTGQVLGVEALIRWNHPQQGVLLPREFLPIIENTDHRR
ncbi:hypothetical protein CARN8_530008 [mine drainage metagenome]|uniref:Uncharacterized protein n=1 Tax=mine drainage metagenome TaxID=410659 RepID=A0A3P3ZQD3_9ZZZZ